MIPPIADRFVAGETAAEAIDRARRLNASGVGAILNLLGEHYDRRSHVQRDADAYRRLLADLQNTGVRARVSVKPSQLGLDVDERLFGDLLADLVETAAPAGFVWIDMEDHTTVEQTLSVYERVASEHHESVGICLQANLRRTPDDLDRIASIPGRVRLVKGAYQPPKSVAYRESARVNAAYEELLAQAFEQFDRGVAVATHDDRMLEQAIALGEEHGTDFEIQMLMGVREDRQYELASEHAVWQYVPYGRSWLSYFYRRLTERRKNVRFALRALFSQ